MDRDAGIEHEPRLERLALRPVAIIDVLAQRNRIGAGHDHPDLVAERQVDRSRTHLVGGERIDSKSPGLDLGEQHVAGEYGQGARMVPHAPDILGGMKHPFFDVPVPTVIGHRGSSGEAPENTLPAFARALELGAAILETDVHRTRDGAVVVYHDTAVDRTTDGRGQIIDHDLAELRALDAGYRFSPDGGSTHPYRGRGTRISTLPEIFEAFPGVRFNIEVKANDPALIEATLDAIEAADRCDLTLLAGAEDATIAALRERAAGRGLGPASGASLGDIVAFVFAQRDGKPPPSGPMALQVPSHFGDDPLVTREFVEFAHAHGLVVHVWTINEPDEMHRLLDLGVDGVMTDYPGRLQAVLAERGQARS